MTVRVLRARTAGDGESLLHRLRDLEQYPVLAPDIRSVARVGDDRTEWRLAFRGAEVRWTQRDSPLAAAPATIAETGADDGIGFAFQQVEGDFIALRGSWRITPASAGCEVAYEVDFRTSVAHLAGAVDPVIGRVLLRSAYAVLAASAVRAELVEGERHLHDLPVAARG